MLRPLCLAAATAAFSMASHAATETISYADFSDVSALQINGSAYQNGNKLTLTPATEGQSGSAFSLNTVSLTADASFSTFFSFQILGRGGFGNGADGLVFTVQTNANNVGGSGGGLGYEGIANSVGIEFDTFDNGESGGSNHVAIDLDGSVYNSVATTGPLSPDFDNGQVWYAWIDYSRANGQLEVRWSDTLARPVAAGLSYGVDLTGVLDSTDVYAGFTSGTGSGWGEHSILSWSFVNQYDTGGAPVPGVPEPSTWLLMSAGAAGLWAMRRRRGA